MSQILDPFAPFGISQPFPFPPRGSGAISFGPLTGGRIRGFELGSIRVGGVE
jgi:hypothetical protein